MSERLISLSQIKSAAKFDNNTTKAVYDVLLNGKTFRGGYDSKLSYSRGDVITAIDPSLGAVAKEALYNIPAGTPYDETYWTTPSLGSPFANVGTVTLSNTEAFPFNNSETTVVLKREMLNTDYIVLFGYNNNNIQEVEYYDKQVNGFKVRYWGDVNIINISYVVF